MRWQSQEPLKPVGQLSLQHTYAGITFGDNWVCAYKAHVDQTGAVFPYAKRFDFARQTKQGTTPNRRELLRLTVKCWRAIDAGGQIDYSQFLVCFPQWACVTREATVQITLERSGGAQEDSDPVVDAGHIENLANRIAASAAATDRNSVLLEVIPHYYLVNGSRKMSDPTGTTAHALKLKAHVTLADRSCVNDILYCLQELGIRNITAVVSPFSAMRPHLSLVEKQRDVAVIEVDRKSTCYSIYSKGELLRTGTIKQGSYHVLVETAHELGVRALHLAKWLNKWEHVFVTPEKDGLPQSHAFSRHDDGPASLEELNAASAEIGVAVADAILAKIRDANLKLGTSVSELILMGEDYMSLRALKTAVDEKGGFTAHWRIPQGTHPGNGSRVSMPGLVRTFGVLKLSDELRLRPTPPIATRYNRTPVDRVNDRILAWGRRQKRRVRRTRPGHLARLAVRALAWLATVLSFGRLGSPEKKSDPPTSRITLH